MRTKVLAFTGLPASGKGAVAQYLERLGYPVISMGDVVREYYRREVGGAMDPDSVGEYAGRMRKAHGEDIWARRTLEYIKDRFPTGGVIVIDGIRSPKEVERFKSDLGGDFLLVAVEAPLEVRFERAVQRGRVDEVRTIEELRRRDERETSWGLKEAIEMADVHLDNSGSLQDTMDSFLSNPLVKKFLGGG
ncbi:MAG: AAA family ATPase [Thermoplasmata archaeon]|nr:AAA family ATPase [Thermoplasmata archaeon]